jgi:hypothetical protein
MFGVDYKFDFRYCNNLIKENISSNKIEDAYSSLINYHNSINNITDFIKYIYNARKNIENNQTTWLFSNPVEIFAKLKTSLMKNDPIENYFPYILHVGMYESEFGSIQRTKLLNGFKKSKYNLQFSELNKLNDDIFYFKIYGYYLFDDKKINLPITIFIQRIKNSIYSKINDKYEIAFMLDTRREISDDEIKKSSFISISYEQEILYGIIEHNNNYKSYNNQKVLVDNLRLRDNYNLNNSNIIKNLKKDEIVTILEVGKYDVINNIPGEWLKIKTSDNIEGWCFGAYLINYIDYDNMY